MGAPKGKAGMRPARAAVDRSARGQRFEPRPEVCDTCGGKLPEGSALYRCARCQSREDKESGR
jgi:hypothetical protein